MTLPLPARMLPALPDEALVERIRAGEPALFELLMRRHNQRLYRAARSIVKDPLEAEDVMQDAYVRAFTHLDQFTGEAKFSTWLTRIAIHEALARVRHQRRFSDLSAVPEEVIPAMSPLTGAPQPNPEQQAFRRELRELLERSIDALPEATRAAYMLRDVEGLSTAEAASCLDITEDALKVRLSRARAHLREALYAQAGAAVSEAFAFEAPRCNRVVAAVLARIGAQA